MIKINKNYKEFKAGIKPVYEEPKRIYYRVDDKYREAFAIFESKVLFNLDISKRKMHDQEKKTRLIVSEISKLKSRLTGFDQYDNPVTLAEPQELTKLYYDIKIQDLKLIVALVEGVVRTRQYTEQYVDILYKRVVLRGLRSLARLKDIALLYDKTGFQNHKVIRVEPLTTGAGTSRATKRLDERIDLVIKHDIDDAENDQVNKKILNYGGIYYRVIDIGLNKDISLDGQSGIDNEEYLIESFKRRLNKEAYENNEFASNYAIKIMTPAAAYEEIWLWTMYGLRLVEDVLNTIKDQNKHIIDKGQDVIDAVKELEEEGKLGSDGEVEGDIIKEDQKVDNIDDILVKEKVDAIEKGESESTPPYDEYKDKNDLIDNKKDIINNVGNKITVDKDKVQLKPEEIVDEEDTFTDFPLHDKDNDFTESFAAGITHRFKTMDLFYPKAEPERIINTFIPAVDEANPIPKKQGLFNLSTLHNDPDNSYEKLLFITESNTEYIIYASLGKLKIAEAPVNLTTLLDTGDNGAYIINVSGVTTRNETSDETLFVSTDPLNNSSRAIINVSGLNKPYTQWTDPDGDGPLEEREEPNLESYFDYNIKETDLSFGFNLDDNHPNLIRRLGSDVQYLDLSSFLIPRADTLEKANKIRFDDEYYDIFRPVSIIGANVKIPGTNKFNGIEVSKFNPEYISNGLEAHYVNPIQLKDFIFDDTAETEPTKVPELNGIFSPVEVSKLNAEYISNGLEAHYVNPIQLKDFIFDENGETGQFFNGAIGFNSKESVKENTYGLVSNINIGTVGEIQGLMYSLTNEVLDSSKVNMPIAEAKPKTETIIKDIQLKQLDQLIFEAYLDKLINDDSNHHNGYNDSWLYFDVDVRDRASESVVISQEKISIIGPVQINTKDFSDTSLQAPGHIPTNTYDILNTSANILKDSANFSKITTVRKVTVQDPSLPTKDKPFNRNIPDYVNSLSEWTPNMTSLFRINEKTKESPIDWQQTKYNQFNSSKLPNSYVKFDDGINRENSVIHIPTVIGNAPADANKLRMDFAKAEIPVIVSMLNTGVSITREY